MKTRLFLAAVMILAAATAFAANGNDDKPDYKSFSLELGTGIQPLHMTLAPTRKEELALADEGKTASDKDDFCPVLSLTEVWRLNAHWEFCLSEGISWKYLNLTQYEIFGTDPSGKPRYNINKGTPAGVKASLPIGTVSGRFRFIWSPTWKVKVYSAVGLGLSTATGFYPLPEITPVAIRLGEQNFYVFGEMTMGSLASIAHLGFGWRF